VRFGVNPWRLQAWMGHKRIVAESHRRDIPEGIVAAGSAEVDPDRRVLKMLGARGSRPEAALRNLRTYC
jgi:hypothetical protein